MKNKPQQSTKKTVPIWFKALSDLNKPSNPQNTPPPNPPIKRK